MMKKHVGSLIAALVIVCLFVVLDPSVLRYSGLTWFSRDSQAGRHSFYFANRQWLADARTIAAAFRYLYESSTVTSVRPVEVVNLPPPPRQRPATNFLGVAHPRPVVTSRQGA